MIGTSAPSTSTIALSTPRPCNAASTCSVVDTAGPLRSPSTVANSVAVTAAVIGLEFAILAIRCGGAQKKNASVGFGGMNCQGNGRTGMDADPRHGRLISQGCLPAGVYAPDHALVPHPRATLCTHNNGRPRRPEGSNGRIADTREGHRTRQKLAPRHNPTDASNINGEAVRDQLTVSYQVLPRSGRSLGGTMAQYPLRLQICRSAAAPSNLNANTIADTRRPSQRAVAI